MEDFAFRLEGEVGEVVVTQYCFNLWSGTCASFQDDASSALNQEDCEISWPNSYKFCLDCNGKYRRELNAKRRKVLLRLSASCGTTVQPMTSKTRWVRAHAGFLRMQSSEVLE